MEMNQKGKVCPIPLIEAKRYIESDTTDPELIVIVDNIIATENLAKLASQKQLPYQVKKISEREYQCRFELNALTGAETAIQPQAPGQPPMSTHKPENRETASDAPTPPHQRKTAVVIDTDSMGRGDDKLGKILIKGFVFSLLQLEQLPDHIVFFNGGVKLACEGSEVLEDLKKLADSGVAIHACGTCLNYYDIKAKLGVGEIVDMYRIVTIMDEADKIIKI